MVKDWDPKSYFFLFPLHAGLILLLWVMPCHAAFLRDIRIGEYDKFTRIAFEFNVQTSIDSIGKIRPGELKIAFPDVYTQFKRLIPQKQSERLKNFEVWQHTRQVTVIFKFNYNKLRFDSFQLKNPPRLVVDVYPDPSQTIMPVGKQNPKLQKSFSQTDSILPLVTKSNSTQLLPPLDRLTLPVNGKPSEPMSHDLSAEIKSSTSHGVPEPDPTSIKPTLPHQMPDQPNVDILKTEAAAGKTAPLAKLGLQYYLLIALVILTIVILSLLVAMLFSRHKWTNGRKKLKIEDLLHRQDEHIASINSQIEEHLKRYDEI